MNPVQEKIVARLSSFPSELKPLADASRRYLGYCSTIDEETIEIAHRPWVAPLAYTITLFPPANDAWFSKYAKIHKVKIPTSLRPLLRVVNGFFAFGLSFYGMPQSMLQSPPRLNRSKSQCLDIASANTHWRIGYPVERDAFYIGYRHFSRSENAGYFLMGKSSIVGILKNGDVVGKWNNVASFLADELKASEERECSETPADWWH